MLVRVNADEVTVAGPHGSRAGADFIVAQLAERLRAHTDAPDPVAGLESLVDEGLAFAAEYQGFSQILVSELWRTPGQWHETLTLLREEIISIVKQQLQRVADAGRLPPDVRISTLAGALFGT